VSIERVAVRGDGRRWGAKARLETRQEHPMNASTATMSAPSTISTTPATTTTPSADVRPSLWKPGLLAGLVAAVATTTVVVIARAADVPVAIQGEQIPLAGFAQLTLVATVLGIVIARTLSTRARRPRRSFVVATVALTAVSLLPDVLADATTASKLVLGLTHLVAAAIVIPTLAKRLPA
jgi:hypothetical protein